MKKIILVFLLSFTLTALFSQNNDGSAGIERYAIFIGSNNGGKGLQNLLYAGTDAIAFRKTMTEIGGIPQSNGILLLDPSKSDLDAAMQTVSSMINAKKQKSKRSEFLFYYSGHSDESSLLLGKSTYSYSDLKAAITRVPSDVHVVILDSCYSGNFIRTKGGQKQKPFLVDDSAVVKGHAYLSSSSSQEFSQESDEIGSSFFTNAMLTGLRGAADSSGDKKVTLNELYSYAFSETLSKTENSSAGPQHPNYNITLVGSGDLVLSDISNSDSIVMISSDLKGRLIIRDKTGKLVSEVNKVNDNPIYLALEQGEYSATLIEKRSTLQGSFILNSGKVYELNSKSLSAVASKFHRVRGNAEEAFPEEDEETAFGYAVAVSDDEVYIPAEFSILNNEISSKYNKKVVTMCSFGLFRSKVYRVNGAMFSLGINECDYLTGLQMGGIINRADFVEGIQNSYIFNQAGNLKGVQLAGIFNTSHDFLGMQAAGILNKSDDFKGFQAAGLVNYAKDFSGFQLSGLINVARDCKDKGFQLGLINIANEFKGFQLGLLNISKNGVLEMGTAYTSNDNFRFVLNSGNKNLYTVVGAAVSRENIFRSWIDDEENSVFICGLGSRLNVRNFNFDIEWLANFMFVEKDEATFEREQAEARNRGEDEDSVSKYETFFFTSIHFAIGYTPIKHLQLFTGVHFSFDFNSKAFDHMNTKLKINSSEVTIHPEIEAGIRFSFN